MKQILPLSFLLLIALVLTSCKTTTPQQTGQRTIAATVIAVNGAMATWNDHVKAGKASLEDERQVKDAYLRQQQATLMAEELVRSQPEGGALVADAIKGMALARDNLLAVIKILTKKAPSP